MPKRTTSTIYLIPAADLLAANKPKGWWTQQKLVPLVLLPPERFYSTPPAPTPIPDIDRAIGGPWYAGLWVTNPAGPLMWEWTDDEHWAEFALRLKRFRALAPPNLQGLLLDFEYYAGRDLPGNQLMDQGRAWLPHTRLRERADAFASALLGWTLGGYVTASEIGRLPGLASWLRRMAKAGKTWCLAEDFNGVRDPGAIADVGAHYVPGFHTVGEAREHSLAWCYDEPLTFLKNH